MAAARGRSGAAELRLVRRAPFARQAGGSGAVFEHVTLEQDGRLREAVLKQIAPDAQGPTLERRFYEELAPRLPLRVPALYASGPLARGGDGWVLLEPLPERPPSRATPARLLALAEDLARAHASLLGRAPEWLPRPFGRDARARLAHVEEGAARLRERMRRRPALRFLASEAALEAAVRLARDPTPIVRACAGAETLIHRDLHHHNVSLGDPGGAIVFDWEAVSAGPPLFDLALLHVYQRTQALALPALGARVYTWRRPALPWRALLQHYLACFAKASPGADLEAIERAAPAAFAWEAVHRIGWVDELLGGLTPGAPWLARLPLAGWVEGERTGPVMLRVWRALFAALPAHAAALARA